MIVPRNRLIAWTALAGLPFAAIAAAEPALATVALGLFAGLVAVDAALAPRRLRGLGVELPVTARLQKDRAGEIEVRVRNESQTAREVRIGVPFPGEIASPHDDQSVALPAGAEWSRLAWQCTPSRRGRFFLNSCRIETASPLGFWAARATLPAQAELRVYPNLFDERKNVAALFLNRGHFGIHAQRRTGKGRDFEKLREYVPGDSYDEIHWKASARRGRPVTKVFQVERTQEVYVVIDASRLSARGNMLERFVTAALMLGVATEQQGDLFGLVTFDDKVRGFVRAKGGGAHFDACRDALYTLEPRIVSPDFEELGTFLRTRLRKRALLVVLTALDDPVVAENFTRCADLICRQHLVLVNMPRPAGAEPFFSSEARRTDDIYERLGGHMQWHGLRELEKVLQRRGVQFNLVEDERLSARLVSQYLEVKARQLL
jgi:uncharacterized protein (DUF58 family)